MKTCVVRNARGELVAQSCHIAESFFSRGLGLMFRKSLEVGQGLLLRHCGSVHTCFMRFPIDVAFIDKRMCVTRISEALRPFRFSIGPKGTHCILELPAGTLRACDVKVGDQLRLS